MAESKHGGARDGSGRKPKAPTTTINFRVPVDKVPYLKPLVSTYIKSLLNPEPSNQTHVPQMQEQPVKPAKKAIVKEVKEQPVKLNLAQEMERLRKEK